MIDKECERCGKVFSVHPSRAKHGRGKHCSRECQYAARREAPKKQHTNLICTGCKKAFSKLPSKLTHAGSGKYCTRTCRDKYWKGDVTPNWQGGNGVYKRGPHWYSTRRAVLKRDGYKCTECFSIGPLNVHHKVPFRMFDSADEANKHGNLITLCRPCHRVEDAKYKWIKFDEGVLKFNSQGPAWQMARNLNL